MLTLFRWLVRLTVGLILAGVLVVGLIWYFAVRSLPDYGASHVVAGLGQPVEIVRTTEGVPHIFAKSDRDAFFALGLAHAQDRLFQMTILRRAAQGRLSEVYGARAFPLDDMARRLGLWRNAQASLASQDAQTLEALDAYAAGVNAWITEVNAGARGRGAPEFFLYPDNISYWQPADSLAILKLLAAGNSCQIAAEVLRARLSIAAPDRGQDIVAGVDEPLLPTYASLFPGEAMPTGNQTASAPGPFDALAGFIAPGAGASANGFAADAKRTAAGAPLLANDQQNPLTAPSLWYLARIELSSGGVIGGTIPGMPVVLTGRNPRLAWGITPSQVDDQDIAMEEVQPGAPDNYRGVGGWTPFAVRTEVIRVHEGTDQQITLRDTANGPVIPGTHFGMAGVTPAGHVAALRWTGLATDDRSMSALVGLMHAGDVAGGERAMEAMTAPTVTLTLADRQGVGQWLAGAVPLRAADNPTAGRMPTPGWVPQGAWTGMLPHDAASRRFAPQDGLVTATGAESPGMALGYDRDPRLRLDRLNRLLTAREVHSRDSFIDTQRDTVSPTARALLPLVGADLWFTGEPAAQGTPERQRQDALRLLAEWDGNMSEHLPEPLIYSAWMAQLQARLVQDELGPLTDQLTVLRPDFIERVFRNVGGAGKWCDVVQSAPVETCETIARQSLDAAILDLTQRFGGDVGSWRWGDLHEARHEHPGLGRMRVIRWIVSLVQPVSGGPDTLARSQSAGQGSNPWRAVTGAGYRGVYDLADPDSSVFVISTGQSGHPLSRHYDDLAELWRRGEYLGMSLDPALARAGASGITWLTPAGN
ncbi:MAG: penicillin acylase family protein [Paracoccus denitrificans]|nr:MAG: penicillin acylase family protein [Paracoccus denitrificans]PZO83425.1 MAG: penicillin acylase family protein [Paracoccus denitrificans]